MPALPSVGPGVDPGVQAIRTVPLLSARSAVTSVAFTRWRHPYTVAHIRFQLTILIYRPQKYERLTWPGWLTCSGWFTDNTGHLSAASRVQDTGSSPARDRRSATVPRNQTHDREPCQALITDHFSSPSKAVGPVFVCLSVSGQLTTKMNTNLYI